METFDLPPIVENYPDSVIEAGVIYKEDESIFLNLVKQMYLGVDGEAAFRAHSKYGKIEWYQTKYNVCKNANDEPVEVIGKITNIQEKKELEEQLNMDGLTGCLTKFAFESLSKHRLTTEPSNRQNHTFLIIDIDNFKSINDNLGHQFGDVVLKTLGEKLRSVFREGDYVGRIGGDEFMVCINKLDTDEVIQKKAQAILNILDKTYYGNEKSYRISGSIGIAKYPQNGSNFEDLYNKADQALYDCKHRGKNGFVFYHDSLSKGTMDNTTPFDVAIRSASQHFDVEMIAEVFNLLFDAREFDISLNTVLQRLGMRFGVGRSYIFELDVCSDTYSNTYEWCEHEIDTQKDELQGLPKFALEPFFKMTNEEGVLYCNDLADLKDEDAQELMEKQGIQSFLHICIKKEGIIRFVIGFDDCIATRIWSPIEINTLLYSSKIIAQFLNISPSTCLHIEDNELI